MLIIAFQKRPSLYHLTFLLREINGWSLIAPNIICSYLVDRMSNRKVPHYFGLPWGRPTTSCLPISIAFLHAKVRMWPLVIWHSKFSIFSKIWKHHLVEAHHSFPKTSFSLSFDISINGNRWMKFDCIKLHPLESCR